MLIKKIKTWIFKNPLEFIFYLFVFLLPWQTRWIMRDELIDGQVFEYGRISLYGFDIILVILLIGYLIVLFKKPELLEAKSYKLETILILACCLVGYSLLSVWWAGEKLISFYWGTRMLLGLGLFWLVVQKIIFSKVRLAIVIVMIGAIQGLLAIWQFTQQSVWQSKWLGMAGQSARELGVSVVEFGIERWLRAYGSLPHPNILGALLVLSFIAVIYLIAKIEYKYHKLFLIFSGSFISLGILFSYSRAAWLGFIAVYLVGAAWLLKPKREKWIKNFAGWLLIYLVALLAVFGSATWPIIKTRLEIGGANRLEIKSNIERMASWRQAIDIAEKHSWLGVGIGNYSLALQAERSDLKVWQIQPAHNVVLLVLVELGIIGFALFVILNGWLLFYLFLQRQWSGIGLLFLIYMLIMFDHFWWTLGAGLYVWWLVVGLLARGLALNRFKSPDLNH